MKNLKKVLALGLALVMILGMFTIASAAETKKTAADFTDWDKVEHKDAVALCVDLGIINGLPDGSFAPDQTIDRASWAKLVYFTATGDDNADAYLGTATDLKDITGNWAESYISYLYATGRVSGDGTGNYMPAGTITVAAGLKTMLTVLGYDADSEGYQGTQAWAGNVITDAKTNGLMDEIARSNTANVNLTRDNAAQIIYNTLLAKRVKPTTLRDQGQSYVASYADNGQLLKDVFGVKPVTATVKDVNDGVATFDTVTDPTGLKTVLDGAKVKAVASNIGNKVTVFVSVDEKEVISSAVAKAGTTADVTITGGVKIAAITTPEKTDGVKNEAYDKDVFVAEAAAGIKYYEDGAAKDALETEYKGGNVVEVYLNDKGEVSMIKVTTYSVEQVNGEVETRTYKDKEQVKVPGVVNSWTSVDEVDGWQGLAEDDVVLVNISKGVTYIEKAAKVTGSVSRRIEKKITVNGTQYAESGISIIESENAIAKWEPADTKGNEYDFYLDKNGDICLYEQVSGEVTTEVAYVLEAKELSNTSQWNSSHALQANLLFTDGTTQIVTIAKVGDAKVVEKSPGEKEIAGSAAKEAIENKLVDFSVNSKGNYELTVKEKTDASGTEIVQEPDFVTGLKADEKTVFMVEKTNGDDDSEFFIYTSYKNVPKMNASEIYATANDKGYVTYVYLQTDKFAGEGSEGLIYLKDASYVEKDTEGNSIFQFVTADGHEEDLSVIFAEGSEPTSGEFYVITATDENGAVTLKTAAEGEKADYVKATEPAAIKIGTGVVTINSTGYNTNGVVCVLIEEDAEGFVSAGPISISKLNTAEDGYDYEVLLIADGTSAEFLYVVRTAKAD